MAERQEHAFEYESRIILENNIIKSPGYTDKWDAFENDIPVSVKNIKLKYVKLLIICKLMTFQLMLLKWKVPKQEPILV